MLGGQIGLVEEEWRRLFPRELQRVNPGQLMRVAHRLKTLLICSYREPVETDCEPGRNNAGSRALEKSRNWR